MRHVLSFVFLLGLLALSVEAADWQAYEKCVMAGDKYFDGDSFKVTTFGTRPYTYVFRLYGADCPETDTRYPERLEEQAKVFDVPVERLVHWGEKAKDFTEAFLRHPFTVHTKKEGARGASQQNRYYAIVIGHDGRDLAEALIEAGLARSYGMPVAWPPDSTKDRYRRTLDRAEGSAKTKNAGIWGKEGSATPGNSIFTKPLPIQSNLPNGTPATR